MKKAFGVLVAVVVVGVLSLAVGQIVMAQAGPPPGGPGGPGGGNFDPAQMQAMMLQRLQEELCVTDSEWATISPLVQKVMELQQATRMGGMGGPGGRGGRDGRGPAGAGSAEATALRTALDSSTATDEQVTAALKSLRTSRTVEQQKLVKAREDLRAAVSLRQEARLVLMGLLD